MAKTLDDIFNDDDSGLLNSKDKSSNNKTDEDRLIDSFEEINSFFEKNNREPSTDSMSEYNLLARLKGFRSDEGKKKILKPFDRFDLLGYVEMEKKTFDEILEEDNLGLLNTDADTSIFEFNHTPKQDKRAETDFVAQREPIPEKKFKKYEAIFQKVHKELKEGKRRILNFDRLENNLQEDNFYLLDGMLLYLELADTQQKLRGVSTGGRVHLDGRTTTIFENGTKSNMLFRSLGKALQKNGKLITKIDGSYPNSFLENSNVASEEDIQSGWIYVLRSKSPNKSITETPNLYKIGFSTENAAERIKNASNEATYLFADVEIVATYRCYNLNTQHFENLIHRFFAECCLNIDVFDKVGTRYTPREWFVVPLAIIEQTIHLIISGDIIKYKYDSVREELVMK
jgi:T5orf172 domain